MRVVSEELGTTLLSNQYIFVASLLCKTLTFVINWALENLKVVWFQINVVAERFCTTSTINQSPMRLLCRVVCRQHWFFGKNWILETLTVFCVQFSVVSKKVGTTSTLNTFYCVFLIKPFGHYNDLSEKDVHWTRWECFCFQISVVSKGYSTTSTIKQSSKCCAKPFAELCQAESVSLEKLTVACALISVVPKGFVTTSTVNNIQCVCCALYQVGVAQNGAFITLMDDGLLRNVGLLISGVVSKSAGQMEEKRAHKKGSRAAGPQRSSPILLGRTDSPCGA